MENKYWNGRKRAAMAMARAATDAEARLIHYELAGRYSIKAAHGLGFMLPRTGPATNGERAALQLPSPTEPGSDSFFRAPPRPRRRGEPGGASGGPGTGGR